MSLPASLEQFSPRGLNFIGSLIYGQEARVVLSRRIEAPVVVALESRTVLLDPDRTGLFDLCLACRLLRQRRKLRAAEERFKRLSPRLTRTWVKEAEHDLLRAFPRIRQLPAGRCRFDSRDRTTWPLIVWKEIPFKPLGENDLHTGQGQLCEVPGAEITCPTEDFAVVLRAIERGELRLEHYPELREMPVATFPLTIAFSEAHGPKFEQLERHLNQFKDSIRQLLNCYRRKSEGMLDMSPLGKRTHSGIRLDATRLVDAVLARRAGLNPRLFQERRSTFQPIFDPRQHLVVFAVDLNGLRGGPTGGLGDPGFSERVLAIFLRVFQTLGVDFILLGCADHVVELNNGQRVYLHVPVVLKGLHDDFDGAFWSRLAHVLEHPPRFPGEPACCHPLLLRRVGKMLADAEAELGGADGGKHAYRALLLAAKRGMPVVYPEFHGDDFLSRTANTMDDLIDGWIQRFDGAIDTLGCYIPAELKEHGRHGGRVRQMF
jgi:hypothetical protein